MLLLALDSIPSTVGPACSDDIALLRAGTRLSVSILPIEVAFLIDTLDPSAFLLLMGGQPPTAGMQ